MTEQELAAIEARANEATAGPWVKNGSVPEQVIYAPTKRYPNRTSFMPIVYVTQTDYASGEYYADMLDGDAEFIAHARTDVPALVAEVRRLREDAARLDWLQAHGDAMGSAIEMDHGVWVFGGDLRAAIDDARAALGSA